MTRWLTCVISSVSMHKGGIAIIGGGWSGLACAVTLRQRTDTPITLFESAPALGGRARGLIWEGLPIDNGQHLTIGAYRATFDLLASVGAPAWRSEPLRWSGIGRNQRLILRWEIPDIGWPWRVILGLIPRWAPQGWPWAWRLALARLLITLVARGWRDKRTAGLTAAEWLTRLKMPAGLIEHFWRPLTEGALNTEFSQASAEVLVNVLRDSLGGPQGATRVFWPSKNLSIDGVDVMRTWCEQHNVSLQTGHRVLQIGADCSLQVAHADQTTLGYWDTIVLALPFNQTVALWQRSGLAPTPAITRLEQMTARAITTVWIRLSMQDDAGVSGLPVWFVLSDPADTGQHYAQVVVRRPGLLGVVISAQQAIDDRQACAGRLRDQLLVHLNIDINQCDQKWITEKSATWACTPEVSSADHDAAQGLLGIDGIYRCADDLEPGYPATIESAVRSGCRTALQILGRHHSH